jgi:hypothetical protein
MHVAEVVEVENDGGPRVLTARAEASSSKRSRARAATSKKSTSSASRKEREHAQRDGRTKNEDLSVDGPW